MIAVFEIVFEYLFLFVGAFILWVFNGFKIPLRDIIDDKQNTCMAIGIVFWILMAAAIGIISRAM